MTGNHQEIIEYKGIFYLQENGKKVKFKPWLGDLFSFLYDPIMEKSIFPKKFQASMETHIQFLQNQYSDFHDKSVLELAVGSGSTSELLPADNSYTGIDISEGLLKKARKKFLEAGFQNFQLYLCGAEEIPLKENIFEVCICNLSLNFFPDLGKVIQEMKRLLKQQGVFICSVPVPERNHKKSVIRGNLYTEKELKELLEKYSFQYKSFEIQNGALLYFQGESI